MSFENNNYNFLFLTSPYLIEFLLGVICYYFYRNVIIEKYIASILIISSLILLCYINNNDVITSTSTRVLYGGGAMALLFIGIVSYEKRIKLIKPIYEIGMSSYSLYLLHPFVLSFVTIIFLNFKINQYATLYLMTMFFVSLFSSWVFFNLIEKKLIAF